MLTTKTAYILETERLGMRPFLDSDLEAYAAICADEKVMEWIRGVETREQSAAFIARQQMHYERHGFGLWALVHKKSGDLVGFCGLIQHKIADDSDEEAIELGYRLASDYWGKGFATEAALAAKSYAFDDLNLNRIVSFVQPRNVASCRVAEKCGGTIERMFLRSGVSHRLYVYTAPAK
ncbi:MAG: GNAT family N-acetyltransferase [Candidatus Dependentiae bacterium]|jgi:RimJ/RimL family protein N-acetyltransferase